MSSICLPYPSPSSLEAAVRKIDILDVNLCTSPLTTERPSLTHTLEKVIFQCSHDIRNQRYDRCRAHHIVITYLMSLYPIESWKNQREWDEKSVELVPIVQLMRYACVPGKLTVYDVTMCAIAWNGMGWDGWNEWCVAMCWDVVVPTCHVFCVIFVELSAMP